MARQKHFSNVMILSVGDWSADGHEANVNFMVSSNYPVEAIQQAYKDSCRITGLQFNHNENYSQRPEHSRYGTERHVCTEYLSNTISDTSVEIFKQFNCPFTEVLERQSFNTTEIDEPESSELLEFAQFILWFIGIGLPEDYQYTFLKRKAAQTQALRRKAYGDKLTTPVINGYWNRTLNVQFGYGLFN